MIINLDKEQTAAELKGSLLRFTQVFYKILTGRDFIVSNPLGRESHFITISKALTQAARLEIPEQRLIINTPPGSGKSTLVSMWIAWTLAQYPDSRYLYISYSKVLAAKHTETIKRIIQLPQYNYLFDVRIRHDSKAREYFQTTNGGAVAAFGSGGAITGQDAGLPGLGRFSGAVIIDDAHKPDEVHSDTIRASVIDNYRETIQQRARGINVPYIYIGQRLHEDDLSCHLLDSKDGHFWEKVIIRGLDEAGNSFYPEIYPAKSLKIEQELWDCLIGQISSNADDLNLSIVKGCDMAIGCVGALTVSVILSVIHQTGLQEPEKYMNDYCENLKSILSENLKVIGES